jgi:hypothetical protein
MVNRHELGGIDREPTPEQSRLDRGAVLDKLLDEVAGEYGLDVAAEDIAWLKEETFADEDEAEFLEYLTSLASENGIDHEEFLERLGVPLELDGGTE